MYDKIHHKAFGTIVSNAFYLTILLLTITSCQHSNEPIRLTGEAQGTFYAITYYDAQQRNLQPQIDSLLDDFDLTASLWVGNSLLRRVNNNTTDTITERFADLLQKSLYISQYTQNCFDCRVGRLVQAWGFSFKQREELSQSTLDSLIHFANGNIGIDTTNSGVLLLHKQYPETELDFNAIAQGYSVDMIAHMFDSLGIESYLINVGGEVIAKGTKSDGSAWSVGIEKPADTPYSSQEVEVAIQLNNMSVVTSGNYRKYYEKDGVRYSHTIDPATGRPVSHTLLSASVVSRESWYADAMATAFMVMGKDKALQFIKEHPEDPDIQAAYFIYDENGEYKTYATQNFKELINQ